MPKKIPGKRNARMLGSDKRRRAAPLSRDHLYCSEEEIATRVLGPGRLRDWRDRAKILERRGLPQIDPLMGGRYWPAVKAFFDRRHGLTEREIPSAPSGVPKWKEE